jgi:AcrR family transcriptional regulator
MKRREKVLESAAWLFGYYGFEKTTVDDIAERSGISKGSVYLEFPNKELILVGVVQQFTSKELNRIIELVKNAAPPYTKALKDLLFGHVMSYWEIAGGQLHSPQVLASANPAILSEMLSFQSIVFLQIADLLQKLADNNEMPRAKSSNDYLRKAELVCYSLSALFPPYERLRAPNPNGFDKKVLTQYAMEMIDLVLAGVKAMDAN